MSRADLRVFGEADDATVAQLERCVSAEEGAIGVLCPDNHLGYSQPIGGAVAYREHVSPSGVGYDIGCGNKAVRTDITDADLGPGHPQLAGIMDRVQREVSFGVGRKKQVRVDHEVLDRVREAPFEPQREMLDLAAEQLGTVGAGNHYVDLFVGDDGFVWVGVHFGSRGFGHRTAEGFLALAQGKPFSKEARKEHGIKVSEGGMDAPPTLLPAGSNLGQAYVEAMELAGAYAYAGRDVVVDQVLDILGARATKVVHNHHNFAWREEHPEGAFWVVRKGCTPAWPGQEGFVGATMGEESVVLRGVDSEDAKRALRSTVHGAGRAMSRTEAAGKWKKVWVCQDRDCDRTFPAVRNQHPKKGLCPDHPTARIKKVRVRSGGAVDFDIVRRTLAERGIELRGGAADEGPAAYKRLTDVLRHNATIVDVETGLRPIGVAMAGANTFDPYKD